MWLRQHGEAVCGNGNMRMARVAVCGEDGGCGFGNWCGICCDLDNVTVAVAVAFAESLSVAVAMAPRIAVPNRRQLHSAAAKLNGADFRSADVSNK